MLVSAARIGVIASLVLACGGRIDESENGVATTTNAGTTAGGGAGSGSAYHSGGADARTTTPNPDPRAFGAACKANADCSSSTCFVGGHGGFCSLRCTADAQCPLPSSGA